MSKKGTILLAEDDADQILMYQIEAQSRGINFFSATSKEDVLAIAQKEKPDVILMDLLLGGYYGLDILKTLKANPNTEKITVIILTNYNKKGLIEECRKAGAKEYLLKAEHVPQEVMKRIEKYLN